MLKESRKAPENLEAIEVEDEKDAEEWGPIGSFSSAGKTIIALALTGLVLGYAINYHREIRSGWERFSNYISSFDEERGE